MSREQIYEEIRRSVEQVRKVMREGVGDNVVNTQGCVDAIPYEQSDELYQSSIDSAKTQVGASFDSHANPLLYYPKDGDVTLSGTIPSLNNAKFQFRFKDSNGCYLWVDCMTVNDDSTNTIAKLNGVYKNWKKDLEMREDIKPLSLNQ